VHYIPNLNDINEKLDKITQPGDMVISIGAGTIWRFNEEYFHQLKMKSK